MKLSSKNFLAVMVLMAFIGGDNAYGMNKRKEQPEDLALQEKDKKQKISTSKSQEEKEAQCFINKQILPKFCVTFYATLKKDAIINETYIKENKISLNECNPYILQNRGIPHVYFPFVRRVFQLVEILQELITTKKIDGNFITKTGITLANLGPENIPAIPLEYCPIIKKAYDQKCEQIKKSRTVGAIAQALDMDCTMFIKILQEQLEKYDSNASSLEPQISPKFMQEGVELDKIDQTTMLGHPDTMTSLQYYSRIRAIYDDRKKTTSK